MRVWSIFQIIAGISHQILWWYLTKCSFLNFQHLKTTLWWTNIAMENHHAINGNSTISMAIFNSFLYVHQRVYEASQVSQVSLSQCLSLANWDAIVRWIQEIQSHVLHLLIAHAVNMRENLEDTLELDLPMVILMMFHCRISLVSINWLELPRRVLYRKTWCLNGPRVKTEDFPMLDDLGWTSKVPATQAFPVLIPYIGHPKICERLKHKRVRCKMTIIRRKKKCINYVYLLSPHKGDSAWREATLFYPHFTLLSWPEGVVSHLR